MLKTNRRTIRGLSLIEMLIYISIATFLLSLMLPLVGKGLDAMSASRHTVDTISSASNALQKITNDIRYARAVEFDKSVPEASGTICRIQLSNKETVVYAIESNRLLRRHEEGDTMREDGWPGTYSSLSIVQDASRPRLYRIELTMQTKRLRSLEGGMKTTAARFVTAACRRMGEAK